MATIECKDCGGQVSKKAKTCPHCGAPNKTKTSMLTWVMAGLFGFVVFAAVQPDPEPGPWQTSFNAGITKTLSNHDIRCPEYKFRTHKSSSEYQVVCSANGNQIGSYLVWPKINEAARQ